MVVHPHSHGISRAPRYSGYPPLMFIFRLRDSHPLRLAFPKTIRLNLHEIMQVQTPAPLSEDSIRLVWPLPHSLATTNGISFDFSSSPYLDVSVQAVPHVQLCIHCTLTRYCHAGFPHSEICGSNAYVQLTAAYRSLSRPSSAPDAKAFPLRSF